MAWYQFDWLPFIWATKMNVSSGYSYTDCPILKKSCQFLREKKRVGSSLGSRLPS